MLEASFASKLVATLNPDKPVIDKFVLTNFGLSLPSQYENDREAKAVKIYDELCAAYDELLQKPIMNTIRIKFAEQFPWATTTDLKKVDLILWQIRE
jgi:hypothetical protein